MLSLKEFILENVFEAKMNITEIKKWISDNYSISTGGKKYNEKPLPAKYINVDKSTGDVTIDYPGLVYLNSDAKKFTNGFKIKKIEGDLSIRNNSSKKIIGAIEEVVGDVFYNYCNLSDLKNAPKKVGGSLYITECNNLISIGCGTEFVGKDLHIIECKNLEDLSGLPKTITNEIIIKSCIALKSWGDASEEMIAKVKYTGLLGREEEIPIKKWEKTLSVVNNQGESGVFDITDNNDSNLIYVKHDIMKLIQAHFGRQLKEEDIKLIGNNTKCPEIEIHIPGVADKLETQNQRRTLYLHDKTNISDLVGKFKIINYVDNFEITGKNPNLNNFDKVFINANPWRLKLYQNSGIKDLSCMQPLYNIPFKRIYICECNNLTSLESCPRDVSMHIYIENCPKFKEFGCQLPDKITHIKVIHCPKFVSLEGISKEIHALDCYATGIKSFEGGIEKLTCLDAHNCPNIESFIGLPEQVDYVIVNKCSNLKSMDGIPKLIYNLSIKGTKLGPFKTKRDLKPYCEVQHTLSK